MVPIVFGTCRVGQIQKALPERLRSKYAVALNDAGRVDTWEPVFAGRGSHISVKKQSRGTKLRLVQLIDGFDSDRVWRELKEGSFGTWMSRIDGCYYQPITTIAYDDGKLDSESKIRFYIIITD
ncbi:hypothetical protein Pmar_PMAR011446 [Perkinsus marinus ATCC 50983]|uniref:Uncharacterized protein n=1 Tax=Perkinsus marinus (strain ATCC 50983 / TXsc) TaxID=423536 RepID=C5LKE2_PERM5|nr:hypothetical protein Pmar_PMAR011446 [Perkinsus marinus ATCC 50983]EER02799.1 hypothetical protein Pmar_PMAR011446 [Perkinsus marinus ATCC 50983]|eukprot:XP_002770983.1 hypothetical protein Pmar_PMAR011446 [Perkinsus marinus ATCC 50983]